MPKQPRAGKGLSRVGRFLHWIARRHPFPATVVAGGMPDEGRRKLMDLIAAHQERERGEAEYGYRP